MQTNWQVNLKVRIPETERMKGSDVSSTFAFTEGIIDSYLAINERAACNTDLHAHVQNRHHVWMDYNDIKSRT
jgi:hypothetical protein